MPKHTVTESRSEEEEEEEEMEEEVESELHVMPRTQWVTEWPFHLNVPSLCLSVRVRGHLKKRKACS